jgi:type I restriction enzyme M protein
MVTKKDPKTKKTVEEQKGWKGKIIPFDLVKAVFYTADFDEMSRLAAAADSKASEYAGIWENMDDEAKSVVCKDDDETAFDTKKFKAAIKSGDLDVDAVESINAIQRAIAEEKALRKKVKEIATVLEDKAKKKVESLSEDEINDLLERKWIAPIIAAINRVGEGVPMQFVTDFNALEKKYADPLSELSEKIEKTNSELKASLSALTGNDVDMTAVQMLLEEL